MLPLATTRGSTKLIVIMRSNSETRRVVPISLVF